MSHPQPRGGAAIGGNSSPKAIDFVSDFRVRIAHRTLRSGNSVRSSEDYDEALEAARLERPWCMAFDGEKCVHSLPGVLGPESAELGVDEGVQVIAEPIMSRRLALMPLKASDATEMQGVLNHLALYQFTGGRPLSFAELRERYKRLETQRSPDGSEAWLNWILRLRETSSAIGTIQAGVSGVTATLAWVIGVRWQRQGFASEAARDLVGWLVTNGVRDFTANIHPENIASQIVAQRLGLIPTDEVIDGEVVWRLALAK